MTRSAHLRDLTAPDPFDVLVVGGGITGAGAALDLAARGLRVALVERYDFGQGTSSRSTKLLHGGIRYLPHFQFGLVSEGLREQKILSRTADFLYRPLTFTIPLFRQHGLADAPAWAARGWKAPLALRAGLTLYDVLGGVGRPGSRHRAQSVEALLADFPTLLQEGLTGGFVYWDAQTDDARLVITVVKTAVARHAAVAVNGVEVESVEQVGTGFRVAAKDVATGSRLEVRAGAVLAATGAFDPPGLTGSGSRLRMVHSKGVHLLYDRTSLGIGDGALVLPETDDGRVLFVVPWLGHAMVGTTDTPYTGDRTHPITEQEDHDYLVRHLRRYLDVGSVEPITAFAGLRALGDAVDGSTAGASREHVVAQPVPGYVQVAGGKLTTYRRIAAEAADAVAGALGVDVRSPTASVPLLGSGFDRRALSDRLSRAGAAPEVIEPTIDRNGGDVERIARLMESDPVLTAPLGDGRSSLADAVHAARHEGASRISDVTLRRTHLAWLTHDHGRGDVERIADVMAAELGWSAGERAAAVAAHERELAAEGL